MRPLSLLLATFVLTGCDGTPRPAKPETNRPVKVAVIGGMTMTGMWQQIAERFEAATGTPVELVVTGPKETIVPAMQTGRVDFLTMHSSDEATELVADGFADGLQPWARNEHVIVGPANDPAGIGGMKDAAAALRRIAETGSPFVDARGGGRRIVMEKLWNAAGVQPVGNWVLKDESRSPTDLLLFAESMGAYAVCGRIPILTGKIPRGSMEILVEGDARMQRPFVAMTANPGRFPEAHVAGARQLLAFLQSREAQDLLRKIAEAQPDGVPLFFPVTDHP